MGYNINTKLPANTFKNNGWTFREWNTNPEGTGTKYTNGANIQITENTTLYAIWDEIVTATLSVTNNKFTEGTQISLGGTAPSGIQKIELKVGNNVLHSNSNISSTSYNLSNVGLLDSSKINQTALANLDFYDINLVLSVISKNGKTENKTLGIKNYTIGNWLALVKLAKVVNGGNSLSGKTIIQLKDVQNLSYESSAYAWQPIGYVTSVNGGGSTVPSGNEDGLAFSGVFDGKGKKIIFDYQDNITGYLSGGLFGYISGGTVKNVTCQKGILTVRKQ